MVFRYRDLRDCWKRKSLPCQTSERGYTGIAVGRETRHRMRDALYNTRLLERCARDIQLLLMGDVSEYGSQTEGNLEFDVISLWDERGEGVPGGVSYGSES
jgi:CRISPR-associated protein Cas1